MARGPLLSSHKRAELDHTIVNLDAVFMESTARCLARLNYIDHYHRRRVVQPLTRKFEGPVILPGGHADDDIGFVPIFGNVLSCAGDTFDIETRR